MVNRVPLRLVWPSRHRLHPKMTKDKSKKDIKYHFLLLWIYLTRHWLINKTSLKNIAVWWKIFTVHEKMKVIYTGSQRYLKYVVYTASSYCNQLWIFYLSNGIFRKHLKVNIIQLTSVTFASIQFEKLHHKGIRLNNVSIQWVFSIIDFSQNSAKILQSMSIAKE